MRASAVPISINANLHGLFDQRILQEGRDLITNLEVMGIQISDAGFSIFVRLNSNSKKLIFLSNLDLKKLN